MDIDNLIAAWVRDARTHAGLTLAGLGAALDQRLGKRRGHTKANISNWERQQNRPSAEQLAAISQITNTPLPEAILKAFPATAQKLMEKSLGRESLRVAQAFESLGDREQRAAILTMLRAFGALNDLPEVASASPRLAYVAPPSDVSDSPKKTRKPDATDTYALQDPRDNDGEKNDDSARNQL
jgi:transcriptional regulator with XRE-family HTH domain